MYAAVEWFFPQHGGLFDPAHFEDVCIGEYFPFYALQAFDNPLEYGDSATERFRITFGGPPDSLYGAIDEIAPSGAKLSSVLLFQGTAHMDGGLTLQATGSGRAITGTWGSDSVTLDDCGSFLHSQTVARPSCVFR